MKKQLRLFQIAIFIAVLVLSSCFSAFAAERVTDEVPESSQFESIQIELDTEDICGILTHTLDEKDGFQVEYTDDNEIRFKKDDEIVIETAAEDLIEVCIAEDTTISIGTDEIVKNTPLKSEYQDVYDTEELWEEPKTETSNELQAETSDVPAAETSEKPSAVKKVLKIVTIIFLALGGLFLFFGAVFLLTRMLR